jgi:hypothetical protein
MEFGAPPVEDMRKILSAELDRLASATQRHFVEERLIEPYTTTLTWEYGHDEPFDAWVLADLQQRDVVVQYCQGGFGALGSPWGINFRSSNTFGMDAGWYPTLADLVKDWGIS